MSAMGWHVGLVLCARCCCASALWVHRQCWFADASLGSCGVHGRAIALHRSTEADEWAKKQIEEEEMGSSDDDDEDD